MTKKKLAVACVGDVLTQPFSRIGRSLPDFELSFEHHDIDQIYQVLNAEPSHDVLIVHASSDFFFSEALSGEILHRMDVYCHALAQFAARHSTLLIVNTLEHLPQRVVGMKYLDELELAASLDGKLFDLARRAASISVVDVGGIVAALGTERALNVQNRLVMRMPYTKAALDRLVAEYEQAIRERYTPRKKVIVVDADNTLWGGIVAEDGVDGIAIDRQYPGILYRRFQRQLLDLSASGVLLALVSKNNLTDVAEAFAKRQMPLSMEHFSAVHVNWEPKSDNIQRIAQELNVGTDSMVLIDDNPFELEQVRAALPEVEVYRFDGRHPTLALNLVSSIEGLKTWSLTDEDRSKHAQYRDDRKRNEFKRSATTLQEYLRSLEMRLEIGINRRSQLKRVAQLTNKTNQFNLTTRRYSEADINRLMDTGSVFDIRLQDRFGDMGVIGVVIVVGREIDTFLLSCRALGRGIEASILAYVCNRCGGDGLEAIFTPSAKNSMAESFYESNAFAVTSRDDDGSKRYRFNGESIPCGEIPIVEIP